MVSLQKRRKSQDHVHEHVRATFSLDPYSVGKTADFSEKLFRDDHFLQLNQLLVKDAHCVFIVRRFIHSRLSKFLKYNFEIDEKKTPTSTSGQLGFAVNLMYRSGVPHSATIVMIFMYDS